MFYVLLMETLFPNTGPAHSLEHLEPFHNFWLLMLLNRMETYLCVCGQDLRKTSGERCNVDYFLPCLILSDLLSNHFPHKTDPAHTFPACKLNGYLYFFGGDGYNRKLIHMQPHEFPLYGPWFLVRKTSETSLHKLRLIHYLFTYSQQKYSLCGFGEIQRDFPLFPGPDG